MTIAVTASGIEYDVASFIRYQRVIDPLIKRLSDHTKKITDDPCSFIGLPFDQESIDSVLKMAHNIGPVDGMVVVGIGGSNLASRAVESALFGLFNAQKKVQVWWADTIDQAYLDGIISCVNDLFAQNKRVILIVVSKSGTTFETITNEKVLGAFFEKQYKSNYSNNIVYGSDFDSPLAHRAYELKIPFVSIPSSVGGRFSAFSKPHLLILALAGIDIYSLCQGAASITPALLDSSLKNPALFRAIGLYQCYQNSMHIHDLFMPGVLWSEYGNWVRQLIGESLGKRNDLQGKVIHAGILPTVSICSTDLHSLGQLYVEGPLNRVTTFFDLISNGNLICNKAFFEVFYSQLMTQRVKIVMDVYKDLKSPFFCVSISQKDAYSIGQLMQMMMVEVIFLAGLMNVNPFDQPGVQLFKNRLPNVS